MDEVVASLKMSLSFDPTTLIEIAVYIKVTSLHLPFIFNITHSQKPKTKEIMHRDVFGYLMKNSSFLHP